MRAAPGGIGCMHPYRSGSKVCETCQSLVIAVKCACVIAVALAPPADKWRGLVMVKVVALPLSRKKNGAQNTFWSQGSTPMGRQGCHASGSKHSVMILMLTTFCSTTSVLYTHLAKECTHALQGVCSGVHLASARGK